MSKHLGLRRRGRLARRTASAAVGRLTGVDWLSLPAGESRRRMRRAGLLYVAAVLLLAYAGSRRPGLVGWGR